MISKGLRIRSCGLLVLRVIKKAAALSYLNVGNQPTVLFVIPRLAFVFGLHIGTVAALACCLFAMTQKTRKLAFRSRGDKLVARTTFTCRRIQQDEHHNVYDRSIIRSQRAVRIVSQRLRVWKQVSDLQAYTTASMAPIEVVSCLRTPSNQWPNYLRPEGPPRISVQCSGRRVPLMLPPMLVGAHVS